MGCYSPNSNQLQAYCPKRLSEISSCSVHWKLLTPSFRNCLFQSPLQKIMTLLSLCIPKVIKSAANIFEIFKIGSFGSFIKNLCPKIILNRPFACSCNLRTLKFLNENINLDFFQEKCYFPCLHSLNGKSPIQNYFLACNFYL